MITTRAPDGANKFKIFRDINSNSAGETEEHIERQEKVTKMAIL